jgi:hypothetical protein
MCIANGQICETGGPGCCGAPNFTCNAVQGPGVPAGTRQCCVPAGNPCTTAADCCGGNNCLPGAGGVNRCTACVARGGVATSVGQCCADAQSLLPNPAGGSSFVCAVPCRRSPADPVQTTGQSCGEIAGCPQVVTCRVDGWTCAPSQTPPIDNTCDSLDQDCDGTRREPAMTGACTVTPPSARVGRPPSPPALGNAPPPAR